MKLSKLLFIVPSIISIASSTIITSCSCGSPSCGSPFEWKYVADGKVIKFEPYYAKCKETFSDVDQLTKHYLKKLTSNTKFFMCEYCTIYEPEMGTNIKNATSKIISCSCDSNQKRITIEQENYSELKDGTIYKFYFKLENIKVDLLNGPNWQLVCHYDESSLLADDNWKCTLISYENGSLIDDYRNVNNKSTGEAIEKAKTFLACWVLITKSYYLSDTIIQ